jgi:hypothetical protein
MSDSFFTLDRHGGDEWIRPTDACRGPWDPDACHAGPPTGMLARAAERLLTEQRLVRLTVDLVRPIPHAGFRVAAEITRSGRSVSTTRLAILDGDGRETVTARGLHLTPQEPDEFPNPDPDTPHLDDAVPGRFPFAAAHGLPMFSSGVEMRYPPGEDDRAGPTTAWMRTVPLLPDEEVSGFARICPLADCGNAIGRNADPDEVVFVNTDLTVVVDRPPTGEWFGTRATSRWQPDGIGLSDALLFDDRGPVGRALQSLLVRRYG